MRKFIVSALLLTFSGIYSVQGETGDIHCFGNNNPKKIPDNRFAHCNKGELITVVTWFQEFVDGPVADINNHSARRDEVSEYCDIKYPVVFIGETKLKDRDLHYPLRARWYSCVYIGKKRESEFKETR